VNILSDRLIVVLRSHQAGSLPVSDAFEPEEGCQSCIQSLMRMYTLPFQQLGESSVCSPVNKSSNSACNLLYRSKQATYSDSDSFRHPFGGCNDTSKGLRARHCLCVIGYNSV
jgi:hypothetical protein